MVFCVALKPQVINNVCRIERQNNFGTVDTHILTDVVELSVRTARLEACCRLAVQRIALKSEVSGFPGLTFSRFEIPEIFRASVVVDYCCTHHTPRVVVECSAEVCPNSRY